MENKKLVNILLKDMRELEELVSEIKTKGSFDALEMEFVHTRSKGILQLLQMLNDFEPAVQAAPVVHKTEEKKPEFQKPEKAVEVVENVVIQEEKPLEIPVEQPVEIEEIVETAEPEVAIPVEEITEEPIVLEEPEKEEIVIQEEEIADLEIPVENDTTENEVELEEEEVEPGHRLGDSFLKGKSINDLGVDDHNKLEYKLSNRPLTSIQASIGINDRFQYIRELFDGSSDKYTEAVSSLDSMSNINEAVAYLQHNFKWKKNETSLKFVNLIKRRFANE